MRRYSSDKKQHSNEEKDFFFSLLKITQRKWRRQNSPHYIVYIVSVHAFKSLCWKAHSYNVWVDICDGVSEGNGPRRATAGHRAPGGAAGGGKGAGRGRRRNPEENPGIHALQNIQPDSERFSADATKKKKSADAKKKEERKKTKNAGRRTRNNSETFKE